MSETVVTAQCRRKDAEQVHHVLAARAVQPSWRWLRINELPPKTWAVWAPAILGFFGNDFHDNGGTQRELLREAYRVAPEAVLSAIKQIATGKKSEGLTSRVLELLDNMLDQALADRQRDVLDGEAKLESQLKLAGIWHWHFPLHQLPWRKRQSLKAPGGQLQEPATSA